MNNYIIIFFIIFLIVIIIKNIGINYYFDNIDESSFKKLNWEENIYTTHILITRFREEDISKILRPIVNKKNVKIFIYNKGKDIPSGIPNDANNIEVINIPNLGWDSYGYISHVINYYDNLPDYILSIHASAQYLAHKLNVYIELLNTSNELSKDTTKISNKKFYYGGGLGLTNFDFRIGGYNSAYVGNQTHNEFTLSKKYPLKNWLLSKISNIPAHVQKDDNTLYCNYYGMFIVNKFSILQYNKQFYKEILEEISVWQSEVNHYLERSWYSFYS